MYTAYRWTGAVGIVCMVSFGGGDQVAQVVLVITSLLIIVMDK